MTPLPEGTRCGIHGLPTHTGRCDACNDEGRRNLAAEVRAVEAGHYARLQDDGSIRVISDTHHDKRYRVTYTATQLGVVFTCRPEGHKAYADDHLHLASITRGVVPCMHAAVAARRLEVEGLARLSGGRWVPTAKALAARPRPPQPEDPFEGLPI